MASGKSDRNKPKAVKELLDSTFKSLHIEKELDKYAAFPHWPEVVGPELAKMTVPEKLIRGKIMLVRVLDASWAQELSLRKPELLEKIHNLALGAYIEDIRFVTGDPKTFKKD